MTHRARAGPGPPRSQTPAPRCALGCPPKGHVLRGDASHERIRETGPGARDPTPCSVPLHAQHYTDSSRDRPVSLARTRPPPVLVTGARPTPNSATRTARAPTRAVPRERGGSARHGKPWIRSRNLRRVPDHSEGTGLRPAEQKNTILHGVKLQKKAV